MRPFFGYIRVSTVKQGVQGVSLQEQHDGVLRYAGHNNIEIVRWFEERETAAKRGRPVFNQMVKLLRQGTAEGVVLHKIDRGARNLKDWADLGELSDQGVEVHLANESLDMRSRGGRLSADIQAVVAADYIRNLREESRKGFYGRLKQGFYPLQAPIGYLDQGGGKAKQPDPVAAPLVRKAFELYATGRYTLETLGAELFRLGLRNRWGKAVTRNGWSNLLNNPFYIGLIKLRRTSEVFPGAHSPLIQKSLFDRVQNVLKGRFNARTLRHEFLFRRLITCTHCGYSLVAEPHKGHVYYRCQTRECPVTCLREEKIDESIRQALTPLRFNADEMACLRAKLPHLKATWEVQRQSQIQTLTLLQAQLQDRLNRLTDAFIDGTLEKPLFEERKAALLFERKSLEEKLASLRQNGPTTHDRLKEFLELAGTAYFLYKMALPDEKRDLLKTLTSNRLVEGKNLIVTLSNPFSEVAQREKYQHGVPYRDVPRTWDPLLKSLTRWFAQNPTATFSAAQIVPSHSTTPEHRGKTDGFAA